MLTEFARKAPYDLALDSEVSPNARHFHLMIAPIDAFGNPAPIATGFTLPNGAEQPFFHVMFPNVEATAHPLGAETASSPTPTTTEATPSPAPAPSTGQVREIHVEASSFHFDPAEITVREGETVRFVVESADIYHTFTLKRNKVDAEPIFSLALYPDQEPKTVEWTPEEAGDYYLYCKPHESLGMTGTITSEP
jgi:plastocyanin